MEIKAFLETTLIDYEGKVSSMIFLPHCNFKCPYCHNKQLVMAPGTLETITEEKIFAYLNSRKNWIDAVVISGGEPTIHSDLPELCQKIKNLGFLVKVDTNGSCPKRIEQLISNKLVDCIAMDIKTSLDQERYKIATSTKWNINDIKKSIDLIKTMENYEFRVTCVPEIVTKADLLNIAHYLNTVHATKAFYLQQFRPENLINPKLESLIPYSKEEMHQFQHELEPYFEKVGLRGV